MRTAWPSSRIAHHLCRPPSLLSPEPCAPVRAPQWIRLLAQQLFVFPVLLCGQLLVGWPGLFQPNLEPYLEPYLLQLCLTPDYVQYLGPSPEPSLEPSLEPFLEPSLEPYLLQISLEPYLLQLSLEPYLLQLSLEPSSLEPSAAFRRYCLSCLNCHYRSRVLAVLVQAG